ncbi:MAG TPA: phosphatidate cytidylyltransferase [Acetobacteraceae bacterium]|jgi:phosphatidate cytidylyltransferase|nr:phosphatidate cytidylyltransferase [Acetobacteraceae bacterium]
MMLANPVFQRVIGGIFVLLAVASFAGFVLQRRVGSPGGVETVRNLNARVRAWWVMVVLLGGAMALGPAATVVLFALISFMALREFVTLTPTRRGDHRALFLSFFVVVPLQFVLIGVNWYGLFAVLIPVYVFVILPAISVLAGDTTDFLARNAKVQWGLWLCVYALSCAPALLLLNTSADRDRPPALLLLYLLIVVQLSDVFQYVCGKLFGRTKLAPAVSPSKTVEGLVGGGVIAVGVGMLLHAMTPFAPWQAAAMSLLIVVAGFFGGLVLSAIKRDLGVKDWGRTIEGHGGILDRVDSVCFAAPLFFHVTRFWFAV